MITLMYEHHFNDLVGTWDNSNNGGSTAQVTYDGQETLNLCLPLTAPFSSQWREAERGGDVGVALASADKCATEIEFKTYFDTLPIAGFKFQLIIRSGKVLLIKMCTTGLYIYTNVGGPSIWVQYGPANICQAGEWQTWKIRCTYDVYWLPWTVALYLNDVLISNAVTLWSLGSPAGRFFFNIEEICTDVISYNVYIDYITIYEDDCLTTSSTSTTSTSSTSTTTSTTSTSTTTTTTTLEILFGLMNLGFIGYND